MSDPYAETDEWPLPRYSGDSKVPATVTRDAEKRPAFDRADNAARLALEVASLKRENARLRAVLAAPPAAPEAADEDECTCTSYVVDHSDPERYHSENVDREDDPNCPVHGDLPPTCGCTVIDQPVRADSSFRGVYVCGECAHTPHPDGACPDPVSSGEAGTGEACTHIWEVEYLPDPMSAGSVIASGDDICTECGVTQDGRPAPVVAPSAEEPAEDGA